MVVKNSLLFEIRPPIIDQLQKSLNSTRTVLGTLTVHAMRQVKDDTGLDVPLIFTRRHVIVNHDLGPIGKISKLGLPNCQGVEFRQRIPVFKPQSTVFAEK